MSEKTCLLHGCLVGSCSCAPSIANAQHVIAYRIVDRLPDLGILAGVKDEGTPYLLKEVHIRVAERHTTHEVVEETPLADKASMERAQALVGMEIIR